MSLQKLEIDALTGVETYIELSTKEAAEHTAWAQNELQKAAEKEANAVKAEADKTALLAKLGITADEAKLLLS